MGHFIQPEELQQLGLYTCAQVREFRGGHLVKDHKGQRDIRRLDLIAGKPLFLKRYWRTYKKDGLATLFRHKKVWSVARVEWENLKTLRSLGISVPDLIHYGEHCGLLWEKFSFILTGEASGEPAHLLLPKLSVAERRLVLKEIAQQVAALHRAGYSTLDLMGKHLFVASENGKMIVSWIDIARLEKRTMSVRQRARDLAVLHLSIPKKSLSMADRMRFLSDYSSGDGELLIRAIQRRSDELLKRSKFRKMFLGK